ncbi:hypothetical protein TRFO_03055 [Tritrichomonas foetus]|uniref:Spindle assembly abnormal protein 6 N-terminal domain-containing protein n=1 Tax=Tritrichomonas foetus TaxID=1144522 RepID=A0A1J4KUF4_9EUKA|nr:hypothetical protein TRFO_03055 [Tritrichomonas foetus]|eukprot:OHT14770.1 hypothetical protein TRFO_03055 [Tritrichomonas foetus]
MGNFAKSKFDDLSFISKFCEVDEFLSIFKFERKIFCTFKIRMDLFEVTVHTEVIKADRNSSIRSLLYQFTRDVSSRVFRLQITDPEDPLFLYDYELNSTKYQEVKREQYLACEFANFPQCFNELLNINNQESDTRKAVIEESKTPVLMLQQNTGFRLLIHLQLQLNSASDTRLKEFLSKEAKKYKALYNDAIKITNESKKVLQSEKEKYEIIINDLRDQLKAEQLKFESAKQQLELNANQKIQQYESALLQTKQNLDQGYTVREQSLIEKYEKKFEEMRQKNLSLLQEKHNTELISQRNHEKIYNQEQKIQELTLKIQSMEENGKSGTSKLIEQAKEITELKNENRSLKDKLGFMQQAVNEKAKIANNKETTVENLQNELEAKNKEIENMNVELQRLYKVEEEKKFLCSKAHHFFTTQKKNVDKYKEICIQKDEYIRQLEQNINRYEYDNRHFNEQLNTAMNELNKTREAAQILRNENTKLQMTNDNLKSELKACEETKKMIEDELNRQHTNNYKCAILDDDDDDLLKSDDEDEDEEIIDHHEKLGKKGSIKGKIHNITDKLGGNMIWRKENLINF